ncbi:ABC transporter substrate-binding protein [Amycolatopsis orientalis]|uniref:ABC transporter substrate-binding protein n=1 Tax=Amycolatopsis orientalis TaxID=31958 RepID=UPI00039A1289|nr:ABC transporter substrate-binding protein [Amycolatopsis orientalis]
MDRMHVSATSHWPNYLPEYIAREHGYFADEGLDFGRSAPPDWTKVLSDLHDGTAVAALGGLWVPAMYYGRGQHYVPFAALNSRNPKVLVMREPDPGFTWRSLEHKIVLAPGAGGTAPYVHTAGLMRKSGVDMATVRWVRDLSGPMMLDLFLGGHGDALVTDAVNGAVLERAGKAAIVARHDVDGGRMPNSVYYTLPGTLESSDVVWRFCVALQRAYDWLRENSAAGVADLLAREWPQLDTGHLIEIVDDLRARGLWEDIRIDRAAYEEWLRIMVEDGLVSADVPYEKLIDPCPADAAVERVAAAR